MKPNRQVFTVNTSKMASSSTSCRPLNFNFKFVQRNRFHSGQIENFGKSCLMTKKKKRTTVRRLDTMIVLSLGLVTFMHAVMSMMGPAAMEVEETSHSFRAVKFRFYW
jgi:hypothetical protein